MKKPVVAYATEQNAKKNLVTKQKVLERLVKGGQMDQLRQVPRSVRQFNAWNSTSAGLGTAEEFGPNAQVTLKRHDAIFRAVQQLIAAGRDGLRQPAQPREERISRLKQEKAVNQTLRQIAERELVSARRQLMRVNDKVSGLEAQLASLQTKSVSIIEELRREISQLEARNAELVRLTRALKPLRESK